MPEYLYQHPESEEYKYIFQGIKDTHEYIDNDNVKWNRIFTSPQLNTVGTIDPFDKNQFINKTSATKGNYGDLMDRSAELSAQRAEKLGSDPIRDKYLNNYAKSRRGLRHSQDERGKKKIKGIDVEF